MTSDVRGLRRDVGRLERGIGRRYPTALKDRIIAYARSRRDEGASWVAIVDEIGGPPCQTLLRWCSVEDGANNDAARALVPVGLVAPSSRDAIITIVSPSGWRLEGVELADAVAILRTLA
jgi:hypothetical protein